VREAVESYEKRAMKEEENRIQYQKSIHQAERLEEEAEKVQKISEEMTERVAKAKLMQAMFELGKEKGILPQQLRFKINGIEE
jgi:hypothetical protein